MANTTTFTKKSRRSNTPFEGEMKITLKGKEVSFPVKLGINLDFINGLSTDQRTQIESLIKNQLEGKTEDLGFTLSLVPSVPAVKTSEEESSILAEMLNVGGPTQEELTKAKLVEELESTNSTNTLLSILHRQPTLED